MINKKRKLSDLFYNNRFLLVFSVVAAIVIWIVVAVEFSPETKVTIKNVPIKVLSTGAKGSTLEPFGAENLTDANRISVQLPAQQTAQANTFASGLNISVGKGARNVDGSPSVLTFYNVCQLLKFEVPEYVSGKIKEIRFSTNTSVAGTMQVDCSGSIPSVAVLVDGRREITILPPAQATALTTSLRLHVNIPICSPTSTLIRSM